MIYESLIRAGLVESYRVPRVEIDALLEVARRDVKTAQQLANINLDWALIVAYNAPLLPSPLLPCSPLPSPLCPGVLGSLDRIPELVQEYRIQEFIIFAVRLSNLPMPTAPGAIVRKVVQSSALGVNGELFATAGSVYGPPNQDSRSGPRNDRTIRPVIAKQYYR